MLPKEYWNCHYRSIQNHFNAVVNAVNDSNVDYLAAMKVPSEMVRKISDYLMFEAKLNSIKQNAASSKK